MGVIRLTWEDPYALIVTVLWCEVKDKGWNLDGDKKPPFHFVPSSPDIIRTYGKSFLEKHLGVDVVANLLKNAMAFKNINSIEEFMGALREQVIPLARILDKVPLED